MAAAMADLAATAFTMSTIEVRGVPMRVFDAAPANVRQLFGLSAGHGGKDYLVYEDERLTYAEVHAMVRSLAGVLHDTYGVRRGDRVAVAMRNYPEWVISYWAIISLGAACVGLNAWWTAAEMEYGLSDSRPRVVIVDGGGRELADSQEGVTNEDFTNRTEIEAALAGQVSTGVRYSDTLGGDLLYVAVPIAS